MNSTQLVLPPLFPWRAVLHRVFSDAYRAANIKGIIREVTLEGTCNLEGSNCMGVNKQKNELAFMQTNRHECTDVFMHGNLFMHT